jgi:hypothetical protein
MTASRNDEGAVSLFDWQAKEAMIQQLPVQ